MILTDITHFNITTACVGGFTVFFCLVSLLLKSGFYVSEPLPAVVFGVVFRESKWIVPHADKIGEISRDFARFVLGIQLLLVGVHLPAKYLKQAWVSICMLLVLVMSVMWVVSTLIIWLCIPNISFLEGLIIASCVTPTDPVLSDSLVNGPFAEKFVARHLRHIIVAESGANDGFGYPFLFLALYIYRYSGTDIAKNWIVHTILYEVLMGAAYGALVGFAAQEVLSWAHTKKLVDGVSLQLSIFGLAVFIVGTAGLIGTDDLLACFIAGNTFTWSDEFRLKTKDDDVQPVMDLALNLVIFVWIGATFPWIEFNSEFPVWRLIVMGICLLLFRRLPAIVALYRVIPDVRNIKEAIFMGYFGPMGVGALFYLEVAIDELKDYGLDKSHWLMQVIRPVVYFSILTSVIVHGISVPLLRLAIKGNEFHKARLALRAETMEVYLENQTKRFRTVDP